jgi:hypothetical protein
MMDHLDNLSIIAQAEKRLARVDSEPDTPFEEAVRELGFDPDEIFAETESAASTGALA